MDNMCTDNRFELIEKYKKELIESTNIETSQDEMAVLDNLLFRFWQMGWRDRLEQPEQKKGRWLPDNRPGGGFWVCSECKFPSEAFAANVLYKFCPNCGAEMER